MSFLLRKSNEIFYCVSKMRNELKSAHFDGLDALYSKTGDHYLLRNYGFVNHPVPYTKNENGNITYQRKIYKNR